MFLSLLCLVIGQKFVLLVVGFRAFKASVFLQVIIKFDFILI